MKKILLIQSYISGVAGLVYPLGLVNLATILKKEGHIVSIADLNVMGDSRMDMLADILLSFKPDIIGISLRNIDSTHESQVTFYYLELGPLLKTIRKSWPDAHIIIGGTGFSLFARAIMAEHPEIDYGIIGEGETTLLRLLLHFDLPESVDNLIVRKQDQIVLTPRKHKNAVFEYLSPDYSILPPKAYARHYPYVIGIETKRGCPLKCAYCPYPFLNGRQHRFRKPELVIHDLKVLFYKYDIQSFTFTDSIFNQPMDYSVDILHRIVELRLPLTWSAYFTARGFSKEYALLCYHAGCREFIFSPDGFTKATLLALRKGIKTTEIRKVPACLKGLKDIRVTFNFFRFPPGQTLLGFLRLLAFRFVLTLKLGRRLQGFGMGRIRIEPHTDIHRRALREGIVGPEDNLLYPVFYRNRKLKWLEKMYDSLAGTKNYVKEAFHKETC